MDGVKVDAEKVCKGLQTAVDSDWMWRKADYIAMCCKDALALIRQQQERIKEQAKALEAFKVGKLVHFGGYVDIPWQEETPERIEQEIKNIKDQVGNVLYDAGALKIIVKAGVHKDWPDTPATVGWKLTVEREAQDGDGTDRRSR